MRIEINDHQKTELLNKVIQIIEGGNEAIVRRRSTNGEHRIEIAEQKITVKEKVEISKQ